MKTWFNRKNWLWSQLSEGRIVMRLQWPNLTNWTITSQPTFLT